MSIVINLRIEEDLVEAARGLAAAQERTLSALIRHLLKEAIEKEKNRAG